MNKDILFNILLNTDIKQIKNFILNKSILAVYQDNYFWKSKFNHDHLPYLSDDINMINEYNKVLNAQTIAIKLTSYVLTYQNTVIQLLNSNELFNPCWMPEQIRKYINLETLNVANDDRVNEWLSVNINPFNMTYHTYNDKIVVYFTYDQFILCFTKVLYYETNIGLYRIGISHGWLYDNGKCYI